MNLRRGPEPDPAPPPELQHGLRDLGESRWKWFAPAAEETVDQPPRERQDQIGSEETQTRMHLNRGSRWRAI